jgi:hypothetical protein
MQRSLVGVTYDLLTFDGYGTFAQFDRCFRKACRYLEFEPDEVNRRKLRNVALWYLRTTGFLDVVQGARTSTWSIAPANLVERSDEDFVLVGGSEAARNIMLNAPSEQLSWLDNSDGGLVDGGIRFFPRMLCVRARFAEVEALAVRLGLSVERAYQRRFFRSLPGIDAVLREAVAEDPLSGGFEPGSTDAFDFARCEWLPSNDPRPLGAGLFRQRFEFAPPRYVIAAGARARRLTIYRVNVPEWTLVAALVLLNVALPARYGRRQQRLLVSRRYHRALRLPTLIERSLRSGTLLNPAVSGEWIAYEGLTPASVARLAKKLPVMPIEETQ